jgi:hypothetical protein
MFLGRPIIAAPVSDLLHILDGRGYVVPMESEEVPAAGIYGVFAN